MASGGQHQRGWERARNSPVSAGSPFTVWAVSYMEWFHTEVLCWECKAMLFSDFFDFAPLQVKQLVS